MLPLSQHCYVTPVTTLLCYPCDNTAMLPMSQHCYVTPVTTLLCYPCHNTAMLPLSQHCYVTPVTTLLSVLTTTTESRSQTNSGQQNGDIVRFPPLGHDPTRHGVHGEGGQELWISGEFSGHQCNA